MAPDVVPRRLPLFMHIATLGPPGRLLGLLGQPRNLRRQSRVGELSKLLVGPSEFSELQARSRT